MREFTREEIIARVTEAIKSCSGVLVTVDRDGCPRARILEDHNPYEGFEFWFATNWKTQKTGEIRANPNVCLYYQPPSMSGYICIQGKARIRTDEEGRRHIWREEWAQYYGDPMAETYVPIQVIPERIQFYDAKIGAHADSGFAPVVVEV